jgi:hypothetical protein
LRRLGPRKRRLALQNLKESLAPRTFATAGTWVPSSANLLMSRALIDVIQPYIDPETDLTEARVLALLGGIAWNLSVIPEVGQDERRDLRRWLPDPLAVQMDRVLEDLQRRKLELFPDDRRIIALTNVHLQSDGSFFFAAAAAAE